MSDTQTLPQTLRLTDLSPGTQVVFVDHALNQHLISSVAVPPETNVAAYSGRLAMVVAVDGAASGKQVAVCFRDDVKGHSCDGRVPHGHGAYVLAEHLYLPAEHTKHQALAERVGGEQAKIDELLRDFLAEQR